MLLRFEADEPLSSRRMRPVHVRQWVRATSCSTRVAARPSCTGSCRRLVCRGPADPFGPHSLNFRRFKQPIHTFTNTYMPHIPTMPVCTTAASDPFTPVVSSNAFLVRKMLRWCPTTVILVTTSLNELELHLGRDYDWTSVNLTRALTSASQIKTKADKLEVSLRLNARFSKLRLRAGSAGEYAAWVKRFQAIATNSMDKTTEKKEKKASHERVPSKASTSSPVSELSMTPSSFASSVSEPMSPTSVAYETEEEFDEELTTVSAADKMYDLPVEMMHTSMSHSFSSARVVGMSGDSMLMEKLVVSERWSWSPRASHCSVETSVVHTRTSIPWVG